MSWSWQASPGTGPLTLSQATFTSVPTQIPNLEVWFDAANGPCQDNACTVPAVNGSAVNGWLDLSGNGYHLNQSGTAATWTTNYQNTRPAVVFSLGQYLYRSTTPSFGPSSFTVVVALETLANTSNQPLVIGSTQYHYGSSSGIPTGFFRAASDAGPISHNCFGVVLNGPGVNGEAPPTYSTPYTTYVTGCQSDGSQIRVYANDPVYYGFDPLAGLGSWSGLALNVDFWNLTQQGSPVGTGNFAIFEFAVYSRCLNFSEMTSLFNYLQNKWNIRSTYP